MANIKEVRDAGPEPNTPSVAAMRKSQADGATGNGTQAENHNEQETPFGQNYASPSDADDSESFSPQGASLPWTS